MSDALRRAKLARQAFLLNVDGLRTAGSLVLLTDDTRLPDPCAAARVLPAGSLVIVRARDPTRRAALAGSLRAIARARNLLLLIADDPRLALMIGANGIHLPEATAKQAAHWRARRPDWLVTVAAHSLRAASHNPHADALLLSPVFPTHSHRDAAALGPAKARLMARAIVTPVFALGGVTARNAGLLTGFAGIAAIGALSNSETCPTKCAD